MVEGRVFNGLRGGVFLGEGDRSEAIQLSVDLDRNGILTSCLPFDRCRVLVGETYVPKYLPGLIEAWQWFGDWSGVVDRNFPLGEDSGRRFRTRVF
jgi:hypothetical protein